MGRGRPQKDAEDSFQDSSSMIFTSYCGWASEILHHQKDGWNPINNGINMDFCHLSTGAGLRNHPPYVQVSNFAESIDISGLLHI